MNMKESDIKKKINLINWYFKVFQILYALIHK